MFVLFKHLRSMNTKVQTVVLVSKKKRKHEYENISRIFCVKKEKAYLMLK